MRIKYNLKIDRQTEGSFALLKQWCRRNRVPMGRILNTAIRAMGCLPDYRDKGPSKFHMIDIKYPKQIDVDNFLKYRKNLTRVKNGEINRN